MPGPAVVRDAGRGAGSGIRETRQRHSATLQKINKVSQVPESGTWVKMPPVHLLLIPEADVYRFFMRPHFTEDHGNVALNLEAYEVVSQLIFGQSKIRFAENFLPPNLGDYEVACHTSEAPGLPAFQGRLPSPQDGRVAIRLLPLAGLLLRRTDMLDKVVISWTHCLCSPHPAAMLLWLP